MSNGQTQAATCKWTINGFVLDLSALSGQTLNYNDTATDFDYLYTPCKDYLSCNDYDFMAIQEREPYVCHGLARWNATVVPHYDDGSYSMIYTGGESGYVILIYNNTCTNT